MIDKIPITHTFLAGVLQKLKDGDPVDIDAKNPYNPIYNTPLCYAITLGDIDILKILLDRKANVNATDSGDLTPLYAAVANGNLAVVQFLLSVKGIDKNAKTKFGTAYELADVMRESAKRRGDTTTEQKYQAIMDAL